MLIAVVFLAGAGVGWLRGGGFAAIFRQSLGPAAMLRLQGAPVLLFGVACNALVMLANGGRMPVSLRAALATGADTRRLAGGFDGRHLLLTPGTRFPFLADVIGLPIPVKSLARVLSIGDVLMIIGLFFILQDIMGVRVRLFPSRREG